MKQDIEEYYEKSLRTYKTHLAEKVKTALDSDELIKIFYVNITYFIHLYIESEIRSCFRL